MSRQYQYVKINDRYYCLQQSPAMFAWTLYFKKDTFYDTFYSMFKHRKKKFKPLTVQWVRYNYQYSKNKLMILIYFIACQLKLVKNDTVINLPVYGHLSVPVHKGYKIFDLRRGVVTKIFNRDINKATFLSEIEQLKRVSRIDFAPSLKRWNIDEKWYEEDYIEGSLDSVYQPVETNMLLNKFYQVVAPYIEKLINFQHSKILKVMDYINKTKECFEKNELLAQGIDISNADKISSFFNSIVDKLNAAKDQSVFLVFSHGDFCPANMLNSKNGIKIIDWESANYRTALFDFYSYFFYRPVVRNVDVDKILEEMNEAYTFLISRLSFNVPAIHHSIITLENVYRWLYYLERLYMMIKRNTTDTRLDIKGFILKYIEAFNSYEKILAGRLPEKNIVSIVHPGY